MIMPLVGLLPVLPMIRHEIHATYSEISIFIACLGIVRLVFAFPSGLLADRFDKKKILLSSGVCCVCGLLLLTSSYTILQLILSRILIGISSIVCSITTLVVLSEFAGSGKKGVMMSMNNIIHNAGAIAGPILCGIIAATYNWRTPFLLFSLLIILSMILLIFTLKALNTTSKKTMGETIAHRGPGGQKGFEGGVSKFFPVFILALFVFFYRSSFRHTLIPFYGKDVFYVRVATLGFYISLTSGVAMISIFMFGTMSDRYGRKAVLIPGIALSASAVFALMLPKSFNPLLISCTFIGAGAIINSMPNVLISDLAASNTVGRTLGLNRIFADSGYFLGSIFTGSMLDHFGFRVPLYALGLFCGIMLVLV